MHDHSVPCKYHFPVYHHTVHWPLATSLFVESKGRFFIDIVKVGPLRRTDVGSQKKCRSHKNTKKNLLPWLHPLAHHSSRVVAAQTRLEVLPAPAKSSQEPVSSFRFRVHGADALLEVEVGSLVAAASLEQVIDGHIEAGAQQADIRAAGLVTPASGIEVHMANRLLTRMLLILLLLLILSCHLK